MPYLRHNSLVWAPASDSARMAMIGPALILLCLMTHPACRSPIIPGSGSGVRSELVQLRPGPISTVSAQRRDYPAVLRQGLSIHKIEPVADYGQQAWRAIQVKKLLPVPGYACEPPN